jgi:hypothetical protein
MSTVFESRPRWASMVAALVFSLGCGPAVSPADVPSSIALEREASRELDDFHAAAAVADEARYFGHFAPHGVFLGTDGDERWDVAGFRAYARAHFAAGKGWIYESVRRSIDSTPNGDVVWFDEDLKNAHLGRARGTGVLVRQDGRLLIAQYSLTVPIPNARMDAVVKLVEEGTRPPPQPTLDAIYKKAYEAATSDAAFDPLEEAAEALLAAMPEAKRHPESDTEFWLHNELTWVRWQQGDLDKALTEVEASGVTLDHGTLSETKRTALRLHTLWDRAYILLEVAMQAPQTWRPKLVLVANKAKADYDALATANQDADGMAVLAAFFLTKAGDGKGAAEAARRVDVEKDEDLQDLYVISRAFDAHGEHAVADAVVARICAGNAYLMKPLIVAQLAKEGRKCAALR